MFLPIAYYTQKFTAISAPVNFDITVDPMICYKCVECPCEYTLRNGKKYILNRVDKTRCILDSNLIVDAMKKKQKELIFTLKIPEYADFYDCLTWYTVHPSNPSDFGY
ncbi:hypothetical protein A2V49_01970 [candidate division WWE3 bacterium RBG_19FT_COMBO_34_6]|uniref:Uncharacterized protein n=1 Tax=candidate division WWE3 bacterium RBG_19FT_COMBO_34_6 TaxID=1802612 RepID=A0A1F4UP67_UNCKA|nr:MAG: hypothetical protein A2V49_01970 [candidate division WWE3 bacterium RBG_19FT_COMBO_34_6]